MGTVHDLPRERLKEELREQITGMRLDALQSWANDVTEELNGMWKTLAGRLPDEQRKRLTRRYVDARDELCVLEDTIKLRQQRRRAS
jgi:hypothetical protein